MPAANGQLGAARARFLFFLLMAALAIFIGWKLIPPYITAYEFQDWMDTQAPFFTVNHMTDEVLRAKVLEEIDRRAIPATKDSVKIIANNSRGVELEVDYSIPVDLGFYQTELHFSPKMNNESLVR